MASRAVRVRIEADGDNDYHQLVDVVRDIHASGILDWDLVISGRRCGRFTVLTHAADLSVQDTYLGPPTRTRMSANSFAAAPPTGPIRVEFVLDIGARLGDLSPVLAAATGLEVALGFHTGPF